LTLQDLDRATRTELGTHLMVICLKLRGKKSSIKPPKRIVVNIVAKLN